jgi:glycosyltransferase involved in cell wall biosynthesis
MRILFVDALTNHGGQEKYIVNLLVDLSRMFQYDTFLFTSQSHTYKKVLSENVDKAHLIKVKNFSIYNILSYISLSSTIKRIDPEFVVYNGERSIFYAKVLLHLFRLKVKFIAIHHLLIQDSTFNLNLFKKYTYGFFSRNFNSKFFKVIFINEVMKKKLQKYNIPDDIIEFRNNGTSYTQPSSSKDFLLSKHSIPTTKKIFGYIGQFNKQKNLDILFSACVYYKNNDDIFFLLIGEGEQKSNFKQKVLENNLNNVSILDFKDDIHNYFQIFDCLIFPSFYEGLPLTLLETISHKVPTITSNIDGHRVVITGSSSTICINPYQLESVIYAIQFFLENYNTVKQYTENAYQRYLDHFNWVDVLKFYDNIFRNKC